MTYRNGVTRVVRTVLIGSARLKRTTNSTCVSTAAQSISLRLTGQKVMGLAFIKAGTIKDDDDGILQEAS